MHPSEKWEGRGLVIEVGEASIQSISRSSLWWRIVSRGIEFCSLPYLLLPSHLLSLHPSPPSALTFSRTLLLPCQRFSPENLWCHQSSDVALSLLSPFLSCRPFLHPSSCIYRPKLRDLSSSDLGMQSDAEHFSYKNIRNPLLPERIMHGHHVFYILRGLNFSCWSFYCNVNFATGWCRNTSGVIE